MWDGIINLNWKSLKWKSKRITLLKIIKLINAIKGTWSKMTVYFSLKSKEIQYFHFCICWIYYYVQLNYNGNVTKCSMFISLQYKCIPILLFYYLFISNVTELYTYYTKIFVSLCLLYKLRRAELLAHGKCSIWFVEWINEILRQSWIYF